LDLNRLRRTLRWFYILEVNQVALYKVQARLTAEEVDKRLYFKAAEIESGHVRNILGALTHFGGRPGLLALLAPLTGAIAGALTSLFNNKITLRVDIALENRAMTDYLNFIRTCPHQSLREILWSNCLDESLHNEWFKARLRGDIDKLSAP